MLISQCLLQLHRGDCIEKVGCYCTNGHIKNKENTQRGCTGMNKTSEVLG